MPALATGQCPSSGADSAYHQRQVLEASRCPCRAANPQDSEEGQFNGGDHLASDAWAVGTASRPSADRALGTGKSWKQVSVPALPSPYGKSLHAQRRQRIIGVQRVGRRLRRQRGDHCLALQRQVVEARAQSQPGYFVRLPAFLLSGGHPLRNEYPGWDCAPRFTTCR